MNNYDQLI